MFIRAAAAIAVLCAASVAGAEPQRAPASHFVAADVFNLEYADHPQISPNGQWVAYVRVSADIMTDRFRRSIWLVDAQGRSNRPLIQGAGAYASPVWSPDGRTIAYVASEPAGDELRVFYLDTQRSATLARLAGGAEHLSWSPDGKTLAFEGFVEEDNPQPAGMPPKPEGAQWAEPARVIEGVVYRIDGAGYVHSGYEQIFVASAAGGAPRRLTFQDRNHDGRLSWSPDGRRLVFSGNDEDGWEYNAIETDVYALDIGDGHITRLTNRRGPDDSPTLSPDGRRLAYVGFDDHRQFYQVSDLYVANADGSNSRNITAHLDRDVQDPQWAGNGAIYFLFADHGVTKLGRVSASGGNVVTVLSNIGGADVGRPYTGGAFSVNAAGAYAATTTTPTQPSDVSVSGGRRITHLNDNAFAGKTIPTANHIIALSSVDQRPIDAWIVRPPDFDASKKYPLLLEIHGGPVDAYGPSFAAEIQLYAAAGYIVVYANPRGSNSYGGEFGNLINHDYPDKDYDDLMSVVDATIAHEPVDPHRLFVTGGSGGGVLTAWIVGATHRFSAAVVQKPVINWTSFALTSDFTPLYAQYWLGEFPWAPGAIDRYWARSPLSRVGNVETPTALITGEADMRTPSGEAEQFYEALRLRHIPTRLIRVPGASHDIAARPSGMIIKVVNTLQWFSEHGGEPVPDGATGLPAPAATPH
jgi:acylaminoacyl-peptidase